MKNFFSPYVQSFLTKLLFLLFIGCDFCEEWYHSSCLNLKKEDVKQLTKCKWKCPKCEFTDGKQAKAPEQKATDAISTTRDNTTRDSTTTSEEESKEPSG